LPPFPFQDHPSFGFVLDTLPALLSSLLGEWTTPCPPSPLLH
jgi:hypothetical protein